MFESMKRNYRGIRILIVGLLGVMLLLQSSLTIQGETREDVSEIIQWKMEMEPTVIPSGQDYFDLVLTLDWGSYDPIPSNSVGLTLDFLEGAFSVHPDGGDNPRLGEGMPGRLEVHLTDHSHIGVSTINLIVVGLDAFDGNMVLELRLLINEGFLENPGDTIDMGVFRPNMGANEGVHIYYEITRQSVASEVSIETDIENVESVDDESGESTLAIILTIAIVGAVGGGSAFFLKRRQKI
jgi:hypothetical protein